MNWSPIWGYQYRHRCGARSVVYQSTLYHDQLIRVRIDVEDSPQNWESMSQLKLTLKARFEQSDIWITAHRIDIV
jgi:hypothetical protein